jgi:hypothetical protein
MREPLDNTDDTRFEQILSSAEHDLWRFEQQPAYLVDDEGGLLLAFAEGQRLDPTQAPGLRGWFDRVRQLTRGGVAVGRVRVLEEPPTLYQRWLQHNDRWNREAGEEIHYLSRAVYEYEREHGRLRSPFGRADWWLVDERQAIIMHRDRSGALLKIELSRSPAEIADAILFRAQAQTMVRDIERYDAQTAPPRAA